MTFGVVGVVYNLTQKRVSKFIDNFEKQTLRPREIALVDYSSADNLVYQYREIIRRSTLPIYLISVNKTTNPPGVLFHKSRCNNAGLKILSTDYVVYTDLDMFIGENALKTYSEELEESPRSMLICACANVDSWQEAENSNPPQERKGTGGLACAPRNWLNKVNGHDERFYNWGREDDDIVKRARRDGLSVKWMQDKVKLLHVNHPERISSSYRAGLEHNDRIIRENGETKRIIVNT